MTCGSFFTIGAAALCVLLYGRLVKAGVLRRAASPSRVGGVYRSGGRMGVQRAGRRCGDASERRMDRCRDRPDGRRGVGDRCAAQGLSANRGRGTVRSSGSLTVGASGGTLLVLSTKRGGSTSLFFLPAYLPKTAQRRAAPFDRGLPASFEVV